MDSIGVYAIKTPQKKAPTQEAGAFLFI